LRWGLVSFLPSPSTNFDPPNHSLLGVCHFDLSPSKVITAPCFEIGSCSHFDLSWSYLHSPVSASQADEITSMPLHSQLCHFFYCRHSYL
jgi:hypothetical protein